MSMVTAAAAGRRRKADGRDCRAWPESGVIIKPGNVHHFKIRSVQAAQIVQVVIVPARIRRAGKEPGRAVIGDHHAVLLERAQDDLVGRRKAGNIEVRAQPEANAHGRILRPGQARRVMPRGPHERAPGLRNRKTQRVADLARQDLVIADQAGEDRQAGRIGRGPAPTAAARSRAGCRSHPNRPANWRPADRPRTARRECSYRRRSKWRAGRPCWRCRPRWVR